jgi:hypothetical protein
MHTPLQYLKASRALDDAAFIRWCHSPNSRQLFGSDVTAGFDQERLALATVALDIKPSTGSLRVSLGMVKQLLSQLKQSKHPGFS